MIFSLGFLKLEIRVVCGVIIAFGYMLLSRRVALRRAAGETY
jgi:hypothetical protein